MALNTRTYSPKLADLERSWHLVDGDGLVLGRLASEVARVLRGKHRPTFAPHMDTGDHVVVVNASRVVMTAGKAGAKLRYRHSGYPGGLRTSRYSDELAQHPEEVVRRAIKGMLPKGPLGREMIGKLKVYSGAEHPHSAQSPTPLALPQAQYRGESRRA